MRLLKAIKKQAASGGGSCARAIRLHKLRSCLCTGGIGAGGKFGLRASGCAGRSAWLSPCPLQAGCCSWCWGKPGQVKPEQRWLQSSRGCCSTEGSTLAALGLYGEWGTRHAQKGNFAELGKASAAGAGQSKLGFVRQSWRTGGQELALQGMLPSCWPAVQQELMLKPSVQLAGWREPRLER